MDTTSAQARLREISLVGGGGSCVLEANCAPCRLKTGNQMDHRLSDADGRRVVPRLRLCLCPLCLNGIPAFDSGQKTQLVSWIYILRIVLYALTKLRPTTEYFSIKKDIYSFVSDHWLIFSRLKQFTTNPKKWKKSFLDALSHSPYFQSGFATYKTTGLWRLRVPDNPWLMEEENPALAVVYAKDEPVPSTAKTVIFVGPSGAPPQMAPGTDNFYELQMRLRDAYTRSLTRAQTQLAQSDSEIQLPIPYETKMGLLRRVALIKGVRAGTTYLLGTLVENERRYKESKLSPDQRFSGALFFVIIF